MPKADPYRYFRGEARELLDSLQAGALQLEKGADGLMHLRDGATAPPDASVTLVSGALEGSNVNAVDAMVNMIELARQFEMQVKLMKTAEENDQSSTSLMRIA